MQQYLIYLIPIVVVLVIFALGFAKAKSAAAQWEEPKLTPPPKHSGVYEAPGVNQASDHPLGGVQSIIRGRIRFLFIGVALIAVALVGLYSLYFTEKMPEYSSKPVTKLVMTVCLLGGVVWGLQLFNFVTYRIKLRRTGFEISNFLKSEAYEYKDVNFHLDWIVEHKHESDGYRPLFMKTRSHNFLWVCQVLFNDGRKPIILKSNRYAWLKNKMRKLMEALYGSDPLKQGD